MQRLLFGLLLLLLPSCSDCGAENPTAIIANLAPASGQAVSRRTIVLAETNTFEVLIERSDVRPLSSWKTASKFFCGPAIHVDGNESCLVGIAFENLVEGEEVELEFYIGGERAQRRASYVVGPQDIDPPPAPAIVLAATTPFWQQAVSAEELRAPVDVEIQSPSETVVQIVFESGDAEVIGNGHIVFENESLVPIRVEVEPWDASANVAEPCFYAIASDLYGNTSPKSERFCPAQAGANLSEPTFAPAPEPERAPESE